MGLFETIGSVPIQEYALGLVIIAAWNLLVMWPDKPVIKHHVAFFDAEGYASTHNPQNAAGESTQNPKPTAVEEYHHAIDLITLAAGERIELQVAREYFHDEKVEE